MKQYDLMVIGGGIAGLSAARAARALTPQISIALCSEERLPYKRTQLSKNLVEGFSHDAFALNPREWYKQQNIDLYTDLEVHSLDAEKLSIDSSPLGSFSAKTIVLATGSMPRVPEIYREKEYHVLYRASDAELLLDVNWGSPVCVIGNGVLGVETAEQFIMRSSPVMLSGREERLLHKSLTPRASAILLELLRDRGIEVRLGAELTSPPETELVLCCGVEARVQLARDAGLNCDHGITTDKFLQTSQAGILAAGDCALLPDGYHSHLWHAAEAMGLAAGNNAVRFLNGQEPQAYHPLPWRMKMEVFDQYFFSIGYEGLDLAGLDVEESEKDGNYRWTARRAGKVVSIVSVGEKDRAKEFQKMVQDNLKK